MTSTLRDYQHAAITELEQDWATGLLRLGISLPTGTGKTHVMAELANNYATPLRRPVAQPVSLDVGMPTTHPEAGGGARIVSMSGRVLVLVHRDTLVEQTERKMRDHATVGVTIGVVKAERDVVGASITIASVHTLRNEKRLARIAPPDLIIVDEAHVSMSPTYAKIFDRFPTARVAGFTATWVRSDTKKLGDFWQKISFQRDIRWAVKHGHLVTPRGIAYGAPENLLDGVRTGRNGDYNEGDLGEAVSVETIRDNVVRAYLEHGQGRSPALFAPTIAAAEYFRAGLIDAGIPAAGIYATTGPKDRRRIFDGYRRREIGVLTTCTALAEGWDAPWCSSVFLVRPTKHIGLLIQMFGRALRLWPGKSDALLLDFVSGTNGMSLSLEAVLRQTMTDDDESDDETEERDELPVVAEDDEKLYIVGKGSKPIDLFSGSQARWLVTEHGVPFIATSDELYFVAQDNDLWNVGVCRKDRLKGGRWLKQGVDLDDAMEYATIVAVDDDPSIARADSRWRKGKPTQKQIYHARAIGCVLSGTDTQGDAADKLTLRQASITLAPIGMR